MSTAFQPNAWQGNAVQIHGGVNTPVNPYDAFQGFQQNAFQAVGGVPALSGASGHISWAQDNQGWNLAGVSSDTLSIGWTQGAQTWSLHSSVSQSAVISWTQDGQAWALAGSVFSGVSGVINWTSQDDGWNLAADVTGTAEQTKNGGDDVPRHEIWEYRNKKTLKAQAKKLKQHTLDDEWLQEQINIVKQRKLTDFDDDEEAIMLLLG